jgi:VRR-NUC domain/Fanconi anemia-associated nuclease SAP domain
MSLGPPLDRPLRRLIRIKWRISQRPTERIGGIVLDDAATSGRHANHAKPRRALPALEPFYYLKNFELVLATIFERYADLLTQEEARFIADFPQVPRHGRALLVRMVMRRGDLFKASKLTYPEIGDTRAAAELLMVLGWVTDEPALDLEQLQRLLTKAELIKISGLPRSYAAWRKDDLVGLLSSQALDSKTYAQWCPGSDDLVYALKIAPTCERFRLLFFGNHRQSWSEFVTADLKIFHFEKIDRSLHSRAFQTRAQIEVFEKLQECRELLAEGLPPADLKCLLPGPIADSDWLEERRQKILFGIAREFERAAAPEQAGEIYSQCTHPGARTRLIRLTSRARDWHRAHALCLIAQAQPESEAELQHVRRTLPRLQKKLGLAAESDFLRPLIPEFHLVLTRTYGAVEYHVRDHLTKDLDDKSTVRYVENGLINALFGLLCWPAVFSPVSGAFFHDFHHGPADLASSHFYRRRQREFDACFSELESDRYRQSIWRTFKNKWGIQSPFVRWPAVDKTLLRWALDCFPAVHLRRWFEWIVRDVPQNRAGFPDLVQFWPDQKKYRLIEVKGPGDRIQDNQRRLLEYCILHEMPVAVCYARWAG